MNKESCSSLVYIKFANGESFGVCVWSWERKKKKVFTVHILLYVQYSRDTYCTYILRKYS